MLLRELAQSCTDDELVTMWHEVEAWETNMTLSDDALLRVKFKTTVLADTTTAPVLFLQQLGAEVWREAARRRLEVNEEPER